MIITLDKTMNFERVKANGKIVKMNYTINHVDTTPKSGLVVDVYENMIYKHQKTILSTQYKFVDEMKNNFEIEIDNEAVIELINK